VRLVSSKPSFLTHPTMSTLDEDIAGQQIDRFVAHFGASHKALACHAALPLILTPELVHYLRNTFLRREVPWVAEADLLLSDLCTEVGYEQYTMRSRVRAALIVELRSMFPPDRMNQVARLLIHYLRQVERITSSFARPDLRIQQWAALAYLDSPRLAREIVDSFNKAAGQNAELARLARITQEIAPELSALRELVQYARDLTDLLVDGRELTRSRPGRTGLRLAADVELPPPHALLRPELPLVPEPTEAMGSRGSTETPPRPASPIPIKVFIAYSNRDRKMLERLLLHLRPLEHEGLIQTRSDRDIGVGEEWKPRLRSFLDEARIILLLVSPDFMASQWCNEEASLALERREKDEAIVLPVLLRPTSLADTAFSEIQVLPSNGKPVVSFKSKDHAFVMIADELSQTARQLISSPSVPAPSRSERKTPARSKPRPGTPIKVFLSYSHKDMRFRDQLEVHLAVLKRQGVISVWNDRQIGKGEEWEGHLDRSLEEADIILFLVSADFLASDYCYDLEVKRALERHYAGEARVIPIIVRPVDWHGSPFDRLEALPRDGKPISTWKVRDYAYRDISESIRRVAEDLRGHHDDRPEPTDVRPLDELRYAIARRQALVVVGAGVSIGATDRNPVASWTGLLEDGVGRCKAVASMSDEWVSRRKADLASGDMDELLAVAEQVASKLGAPRGGEYRRWLRETVGTLRAVHREVLEALRDLNVKIATTNYDGLIEEITRWPAVTWQDGSKVERVLREAEPGVFHVHGYWDRSESVILGIRDYDRALGNDHAQTVQKAIRATQTLLFVGCGEGLRDPNFDAFLRWTRGVFAGSEYRHFLLAVDREAAALQTQHPAAERIFVLSYGDSHADLAPFLRSLAVSRS
jgi:hypothetical protein